MVRLLVIVVVCAFGAGTARATKAAVAPGTVEHANVQAAITFLQNMGETGPAASLGAALAAGKIYTDDTIDKADTAGNGDITVPAAYARLGTSGQTFDPSKNMQHLNAVVGLARTLFHENVHVGQGRCFKAGSNLKIGETPHEQEAWEATILALTRWMEPAKAAYRADRSLANLERYATMLGITATYVADYADGGCYGNPSCGSFLQLKLTLEAVQARLHREVVERQDALEAASQPAPPEEPPPPAGKSKKAKQAQKEYELRKLKEETRKELLAEAASRSEEALERAEQAVADEVAALEEAFTARSAEWIEIPCPEPPRVALVIEPPAERRRIGVGVGGLVPVSEGQDRQLVLSIEAVQPITADRRSAVALGAWLGVLGGSTMIAVQASFEQTYRIPVADLAAFTRIGVGLARQSATDYVNGFALADASAGVRYAVTPSISVDATLIDVTALFDTQIAGVGYRALATVTLGL